ncbi:MAG TPA: ABC transporter permease, partial [Dongiaceae bacterium]
MTPLTPKPDQVLLDLSQVSKTYRNGEAVIRALDSASLQIHAGEFVAIMGQSGSGKSTLMNIIGCLDRPTAGRYSVAGRDVSRLSPDELAALRSRMFGFVFQRYNLLGTATAVENVEIPGVYAGRSRRDRLARATMLLKRLGLGERAGHKPSELSGGQQQRVSIARALMNDAQIILADEPTGALDSKSGEDLLALLHELHASGRTIVLITHDPAIAAQAERVIQIRDGHVISDTGAVLRPPAPGPRAAVAFNRHSAPLADIAEATKTAIRSLRANLFRTLLTLLGVVIGVAAVVVMLAIGNGSQQQVLDRITAMGTNLLIVRPGAPGVRSSGDTATLVPADAEAIAGLPNVEAAVPERNSRATLRVGNIDYQTSILGTSGDYTRTRGWDMADGAFISADDVRGYAPVIVLGRTVARNLFPDGENPVGRYVLVRNVPMQVIGVLAPKGATPFGNDQDDVAVVPLTTGFVQLFGRQYLSTVSVKVTDAGRIDQTETAIENLLQERHRTIDFQVRNTASILATAQETQGTLTLLLASVAAVSLLVGGIGVMNIMLVNVT